MLYYLNHRDIQLSDNWKVANIDAVQLKLYLQNDFMFDEEKKLVV